jgi:dihydroorotase
MPSPKPSHPPLLLVNARLIDPAVGMETRGGLLVQDGRIADLGPSITQDSAPEGASIVDCAGDVVAPGLIDMQAFVGEPGAEHRETIATATMAAAAGGVTTLVATSATSPAVDDPAVVDFVFDESFQRRAAFPFFAVHVINNLKCLVFPILLHFFEKRN